MPDKEDEKAVDPAPDAKDASKMDVDEDAKAKEESEPSEECRVAVAEVVSRTKSTGDLTKGLEDLLQLEKRNRLKEEKPNTIFVCDQIVQQCYEFKNWKALGEYATIVSKRRSQFKECTRKVVQSCYQWIDQVPGEELQVELITALLEITKGKIYVECERARLTMRLSKIKEKNGDTQGAWETLVELQIETYGSMEKREKCEFLLEQMRLSILCERWIRVGIIRNKITGGGGEDKVIREFKDLEQTYWKHSAKLFNQDEKYLELARGYRRMVDIFDAEDTKKNYMANAVVAAALTEFDIEVNGLFQKFLNEDAKMLDGLPVFRSLLKLLTTHELIAWPLPTKIHSLLCAFQLAGIDKPRPVEPILKDRVVQHNIRVIAKYYTHIQSERLARFLNTTRDEMEDYVSALVSSGKLYAKIDRLAENGKGTVSFLRPESAENILDGWRGNIEKLLGLVDGVCHQIHKEQMIHRAK